MNDNERDEMIERVSKALDVPEPSPLFWDHFPGRVRAAVHAAPARSPSGWWTRRGVALAVSMTAVAALATATFIRSGSDVSDMPELAMTQGAAPLYDIDMMDGDAGWAVVSAVAESAGADLLREAGFGMAPGGTEPAIEALNDAERVELMALLQAEMKGDD